MLKDKTIKVIDTEAIEVNSFITFAPTFVDDDGKRKARYKVNGIVSYVSEDYITVTMYDGERKRIDASKLLDGKYIILGMMSDATGTEA